MSPDQLSLLRCPESGARLELAGDDVIARLNADIALGRATNRAGEKIARTLDAGLIPTGGSWLYPVCNGLPILIRDEAIPLGA